MKEEDFDFGFGEKLEDNDLDLEFEDEFDDDGLEELPREGTPLYSVMTANGILTLEDRKKISPIYSRQSRLLHGETNPH